MIPNKCWQLKDAFCNLLRDSSIYHSFNMKDTRMNLSFYKFKNLSKLEVLVASLGYFPLTANFRYIKHGISKIFPNIQRCLKSLKFPAPKGLKGRENFNCLIFHCWQFLGLGISGINVYYYYILSNINKTHFKYRIFIERLRLRLFDKNCLK